MDTFLGCFVLIAVAALLVPFILTIVHARQIKALDLTLQKLTKRIAALESGAPVAGRTEPMSASAPVTAQPVATRPATTAPVSPPVVAPPPVTPQPPPLTPIPPPPVVAPATPPPKPAAPKVAKPAIDWEAFMGVKLFAWVGGFALFLGVVFLVKYSF